MHNGENQSPHIIFVEGKSGVEKVKFQLRKLENPCFTFHYLAESENKKVEKVKFRS